MRADHGPGVYFPTTLTKPRCVPYFHQKESLRSFRVDVKRKFIEDKVRREKVFEDWSSSKTLPEVRNNKVADALSRKMTLLVSISNEVIGFDSIKELYASDGDFCNIWIDLETKQLQGEFILLDGYLFKGNRLCILKTSRRSQLIKEVHSEGLSAHLGGDKTIASVESQFYWPRFKRDVGAFVKRCVVCQEGKGKTQNTEEQHLVVSCSDKEIVKFPTQLATIKISGEDGINLEEFSNVLTIEEADITRPIMAVEDDLL
ncbi:RNA-directed DNA polymerase [Tanacetum coccineum]